MQIHKLMTIKPVQIVDKTVKQRELPHSAFQRTGHTLQMNTASLLRNSCINTFAHFMFVLNIICLWMIKKKNDVHTDKKGKGKKKSLGHWGVRYQRSHFSQSQHFFFLFVRVALISSPSLSYLSKPSMAQIKQSLCSQVPIFNSQELNQCTARLGHRCSSLTTYLFPYKHASMYLYTNIQATFSIFSWQQWQLLVNFE